MPARPQKLKMIMIAAADDMTFHERRKHGMTSLVTPRCNVRQQHVYIGKAFVRFS